MRPTWLFLLNWPVTAPGGVNEVVLSVASRLANSSRFIPLIGVIDWEHDPAQPLPSAVRGVEVIRLRLRAPLPEHGVRGMAGLGRTLLPDILALLHLIGERNVRIINAHFPTLNICVPLLMKWLGLFRGIVALSFHGADLTEAQHAPENGKRLWRNAIRRADVSIACSASLAAAVRAFVPVARVEAIHNGAELDLFRRPPLKRNGPPSLLHIGKYESKKGQDILLRAFREVLGTVPDARLVLVGARGDALEATRNLVVSLGLEKSVEMHVDVPHERIPGFTSQADLFVLPSRAEPFGIVLLEAGAAGLPVAATRTGGIPELIENEVTGLLVPPGSVEDLRDAVLRLLDPDGPALRLAEAWQSRVLENFSWDSTVERYVSVMERYLSGREV